jgi:glyceraldehyde-3-phosphate dehydrogenase (NAD(P)+) (phosphorylating)
VELIKMQNKIEPVRFVVFGNGQVGYKAMRYAQEVEGVDLVGFVEKDSNLLLRSTQENKMPLFAFDDESFEKMQKEGYSPEGLLDDLLKKDFDFAIDATDQQLYFLNKISAAREIGVPIIGQGSLKEDQAESSTSSLTNLDQLMYNLRPRKVSCNTTGASRAIHVAKSNWGLRKNEDGVNYKIELVRRTSDRGKQGISGLQYSTGENKQHHADDIDSVLDDVTGSSRAVMASHKRFHMQMLTIYLDNVPMGAEEIMDAYSNTPRISYLPVDDTEILAEHFSRSGRIMEDMPENAISSIKYNPKSNSVEIVQYIDNISIVCPENIDMMIKMKNPGMKKQDIIQHVDTSLDGILPGFSKDPSAYQNLK